MVRSHRILFPVSFSNYPFAVSPTVGETDRSAQRGGNFAACYRCQQFAGFKIRASHRDARRPDPTALQPLHRQETAITIARGSNPDYIRGNEIEMMVMGARDSDGFGKGPLGQVATGILREACCPVWLEWRNGGQQSVAPAAAARICCAIDGTDRLNRFFAMPSWLRTILGAS